MPKIEEWIKNNTFHHSQFFDQLELLRQKEKTGLSISLCIPTLNEEATIGKEIVIMRSELQERYPLVDEIAVIDSGSTDKTLEVAAAFGACTAVNALQRASRAISVPICAGSNRIVTLSTPATASVTPLNGRTASAAAFAKRPLATSSSMPAMRASQPRSPNGMHSKSTGPLM